MDGFRMNDEFDLRPIERRIDSIQQVGGATSPTFALDREEEDPLGDIPQELFGDGPSSYASFRAVLVSPTTVRVYAGYRKVIGQAAALYSSSSTLLDYWEFTYTGGNVIQFKWTYSTQSGGTITDGSWSTIEADTEENDSDLQQVFVIARMVTDGDGGKHVVQCHCGDVTVEDRIVCVDCP